MAIEANPGALSGVVLPALAAAGGMGDAWGDAAGRLCAATFLPHMLQKLMPWCTL
jgi:hypothetical protein